MKTNAMKALTNGMQCDWILEYSTLKKTIQNHSIKREYYRN